MKFSANIKKNTDLLLCVLQIQKKIGQGGNFKCMNSVSRNEHIKTIPSTLHRTKLLAKGICL